MKTIIILDGSRINIIPPDLDGNGKAGENINENMPFSDPDEKDIVQPTELGEALKEMDSDNQEKGKRMSGIDMRARLHPIEISALQALDNLIDLRFLHDDCLPITRQKKRLSVSINGKGREERRDVIIGKRDQDTKKGLFGMVQPQAKQ